MVVVEQTALDSLIAVAGGGYHSLGLKSNGTIVAWGNNDYGQCNVPAPNADFIAVAGGDWHSLGLKSDGTIVAWGDNGYGQCNVPAPNADFIAVAGGYRHSLGLKRSSVAGIEDHGSGDVPGASSLAIRSVFPNPFSPSMEISFEILVSSSVTLEIYDVSGRRTGAVALGSFGPGVHRVRWDGRDARGCELASGVYFLRLRGAVGESQALKALLLR
jgi:hypothetical protein